MGGKPKLETISPAYRAYLTLDRLPKSAPHFKRAADGSVCVEMREIFCRMRGCGKKPAVGHLTRHLSNVHNTKTTPGKRGVTASKEVLRRAQEFYMNLMSEVAYQGKRSLEDEIAATNRFWAEKGAMRPSHGLSVDGRKRTKKMGQRSRLASMGTAFRDDGADDDDEDHSYDYDYHVSNDDDDEEQDLDSNTTPPAAGPPRRRRSPTLLTQQDSPERLETNPPRTYSPERIDHDELLSSESSISTRRKREVSMSVEPVVKKEERAFILIEDDTPESSMPKRRKRDVSMFVKPVIKEERTSILIEDHVTKTGDVEDIEDVEFEMEKAEIKQAQLQARLEIVQLKQKMASMKKRKAKS